MSDDASAAPLANSEEAAASPSIETAAAGGDGEPPDHDERRRRRRPSNRRPADVVSFTHNDIAYECTFSCFATGEPAEAFLEGGKVGSEVQHVARDGAVILSLALQHGTPLDALRNAITRLDDGSPAGPLGRLLDIVADERDAGQDGANP